MRGRLGSLICGGLAALAAGALPACDRGDTPIPSEPEQKETVPAPPMEQRPTYKFMPGLREEHPEVCGFVREFLETCLAGNYEDYRKLVSRAANPESKERFQAIYYAIKSVTVETIEAVELPGLPAAAYRVVSTVDFHPDRKVSLRAGANRDIAILVFKEEGRWRMVPAPAELQPEEEHPATTSAPTTSAPHYPWDEDGDY
jgi:hypothetical protein